MRLEDLDYDLPEELIAQEPLADRAASRLLRLDRQTGEVEHLAFRDVPRLLAPGDLLVMNDTRVSALRLFGERPTGGRVELLLLREREDGWEALAKPARKLGPGERVSFGAGLESTVLGDLGEGRRLLRFTAPGDVREALAALGETPLPPYVRTKIEDPERYQTVYASTPGSAAAPTAGLHFTEEVLAELEALGVRTARVTLDVGIDTFRPISADDPLAHRMHGERCRVPQATADAVADCEGRVIAVGTTSVRTLESMAVGPRQLVAGERDTDLYITPGFLFRVVDGMFTNFHMPRTTMLMMLAALAGHQALMDAYREAVERRYRFLSFGDSMFVS